ncbi:MAG TPA: hypothetical protein VFE47_28750 [Tepidisphaeraceae bacterium]|jgi:hypothetical protein|nr:hypothetical protein [Tepidisphaeraceae bacterium]
MHHRQLTLGLAALVLVGCAFTTPAFAQLPSSVVTAASPPPEAIEKSLDVQVGKLLSPDPALWSQGRTTMIGDVSKQDASTGFLDAYALSLNAHLLPLTKNKDARVRLNAAIVAARVAAKAKNGRLAPVTLALLKDSSDAVVLWALQSAKFVVPPLLAIQDSKDADDLGKAVVQAAQTHTTPSVIEEAYHTLLLDPTPQGPSLVGDISPKVLSSFLQNTLALYDFRVKLYDTEPEPPKDSQLDTAATVFLTSDKVWGVQTKAQQGQTLALMLALARGAAKQNAAVPSPEMFDVVKRTGQALSVVANRMPGQKEFSDAAKKLSQLPNSASPDEINPALDSLEAAIKALGLPTPPATPTPEK